MFFIKFLVVLAGRDEYVGFRVVFVEGVWLGEDFGLVLDLRYF